METRRRIKRSIVVTNEVTEEEVAVDTVVSDGHTTEAVSSSEQTVKTLEEDNQDEQDSQMDTVIEVKGSTSTPVTVSWDKKDGEGQHEDAKKITDASDQMINNEDQVVPSADAISPTENAPGEGTETEVKQETQEPGDSQTNTCDTEKETPPVTVTCEDKNEEGEAGDIHKETNGEEQMSVEETAVNGKRKAPSAVEMSPSKKTKLINDGFCIFVGNLNKSKTSDEVKNSLANYFMTQSLLVQDIRLDRSKKHAYIDLASEMDLTKALTLDGETILENPMKIARAKVKSEDQVKVKATAEEKKAARDARCLFLKSVPYTATKEDILKVFRNAVNVRFPGGAEGPDKGIAFVEFKSETIAKKVQQRAQVPKIQGRTLIVDSVGTRKVPEVTNNDDNNNTKAETPPNNTLFVSNLSYNIKEKNLKKVFQNAVSIKIPELKGKSRGYSFVEFATVEDAAKALKSSKEMKLCKRPLRVQFYETREKREVLSKTLVVLGLAEKTTAETLEGAFEGAQTARIAVDKETGISKRFGFVYFENEENCKAVKEAMEDCEIDGSNVCVAYARPKAEKGAPGAKAGLVGRAVGRPAAKAAATGKKGNRGGKGLGTGKAKATAKQVKNKA